MRRQGVGLVMAGVVTVATLAIWALFPRIGVVGALFLVVTVPTVPLAVWGVIGMWRGTQSHLMLIKVPVVAYPLSLSRWQACGPCLAMSAVGMFVFADLTLVADVRHPVVLGLAMAALAVFFVFMGLAFLVAATMGPAFLLPAAMRRGRST
ncbi:MAG: hypothetical protein QOE11_301 [Solirubrobacteraceae bacterium]|jgi:hypothetical protein|nr:hypothetical protein [Solirubrobacteraceae bacterium]